MPCNVRFYQLFRFGKQRCRSELKNGDERESGKEGNEDGRVLSKRSMD
jgi:hypothetical protein